MIDILTLTLLKSKLKQNLAVYNLGKLNDESIVNIVTSVLAGPEFHVVLNCSHEEN